MPTGTIAPFVKAQFFTNSGLPAVGYKLFTYIAGSTTKLATYLDVNLSSANTNPIVLDAAGRATIFLQPAVSYKFVFAPPTDTDPPTSAIWTVDNVRSVPTSNVDVDVDAVAGENIAALDAVYMSQGVGGTTAGRWYRTDSTVPAASRLAPIVGIAINAITASESGTVRIAGRVTGFTSLSAGSIYAASSTPGAMTLTLAGLAWTRTIAQADSASSVVIIPLHPDDPPLTLATKYTVTGGTGGAESTLFETVIPGELVYTPGASIRALFWGATANNANGKNLRIYLVDGGTANVLILGALTINEDGRWLAGVSIMRGTLITDAQSCAQISSGPSNGPVSASITDVTTPTLSWGNQLTLRVTGQSATTDDVRLNASSVIFVPPQYNLY